MRPFSPQMRENQDPDQSSQLAITIAFLNEKPCKTVTFSTGTSRTEIRDSHLPTNEPVDLHPESKDNARRDGGLQWSQRSRQAGLSRRTVENHKKVFTSSGTRSVTS